MAAQFFLKNVHPDMRSAAIELFGEPELHSRPNVFGELMRVLILPSAGIEAAVKSVLANAEDPDMALHMRMLMNRSVRALQAALNCLKKAMQALQVARPKVLHFDYELFRGNLSLENSQTHILDFRIKDWGPAPRWVAFVDFFLASRAKHAVISGAHRRVGTTYAQLIAALAAAHNLDENLNTSPNFSFLSSFQSNLLISGLSNQIGWGHAWNRFAGPLSCRGQASQCAHTPLLPPAWWDGICQSPIPRDIRRLEAYGVRLSSLGTIDGEYLQSFCRSRKTTVVELPVSLM